MNTPPESAPELSASASPPGEAVAIDSSSPPAPSTSPGARRASLHRKRRRQGFRSVRVLVHNRDIEAMVSLGHLKEEKRGDPEELERAVYSVVDMALDGAKYPIARGRAPRRNV